MAQSSGTYCYNAKPQRKPNLEDPDGDHEVFKRMVLAPNNKVQDTKPPLLTHVLEDTHSTMG